ncbi:MAG TPA: hypothetical protein VM889_09265 [Candidatus Thermoplasmatota archaeon]|nr:hypothetical protein [Candidatus Thermoplasmatota archaeon]
MHLIKDEEGFASVRELARRLAVGHTKVAEVVRFLQFHQAVRPDAGRWAVEWEKTARLLGALRLSSVVPVRTVDAAVSQAEVRDRLEAAGVPHVFAFTTAANALAYFEPQPETCVYVEKRRAGEAARLLQLESASNPRRARSLASHPRVLLFGERLAVLDSTASAIGTITSLHQTYVDLLHYPLAGAQADFLKKAIMKQRARRSREGDAGASP